MNVLHEPEKEYEFDSIGRLGSEIPPDHFSQHIVGEVLLIEQSVALIDEINGFHHAAACLFVHPIEILIHIGDEFSEYCEIQLIDIDDLETFE